MNDLETKRAIEDSLKAFSTAALAPAAIALFESLGYRSQKRLALKPNTPENFVATFAKEKPLNPDHALLADWQSVDFLFQITDEEIRAAAAGHQQFLFESKGKWNGAAMESYLFFAITLAKPHYTRTELFRHHPCREPPVPHARDAPFPARRYAHARRHQSPLAQAR